MDQTARIEALEEEVAYLKSELGLSLDHAKTEALRTGLNVTPCQAKMLLALRASNGRVMSNGFLLDNFTSGESDRLVHVHIVNIRKSIGHDAIANAWGMGYYLTEEGKQRIDQILQPPANNHNTIKQYCKHGHHLWGDNVYTYRGKRRCRACHKLTDQRYREGLTN